MSSSLVDDDPASERPSKSQRKRDSHALQNLGKRLMTMAPAQWRALDLPEPLRDALEEGLRVSSHEGRRRHLQYIGKLMRTIDPAPLTEAINSLTGESRAAVALMHRCEKLRDALLDDDAPLTTLIAEHPSADVQALRATIRAARREREAGSAPRHARELYRQLHALLSDRNR